MASTLLGATANEFVEINISRPVAWHLSNKLLQQKQPIIFLVGATVRGALHSNGVRGNLFKFLERHNFYFSKEEGIQIVYEERIYWSKYTLRKKEMLETFKQC